MRLTKQNPINRFSLAVWTHEGRRGAFRVTPGVQLPALTQVSSSPWLEEAGFEVAAKG